jgi:hypothetical protein
MAPRLTLRQQTILRFPPTKATWLCSGQRTVHDPAGEKKTVVCNVPNSGNQKKCWLCGKTKPSKPRLVWPLYVETCAKAGIEPGTRWPITDTPQTPKRPTRRKGARSG